ncbi:MAG: twin-arginine translocase TatA/TatE family subunit [Gemmatimonadota bacterium]
MFGGIGPWELVMIFLVVLLLFGAKRLPEIGSSLGKGIREFKGSFREIESELKMPEDDTRQSRGSVAPPRTDTAPEVPRKEDQTSTESRKMHSQ